MNLDRVGPDVLLPAIEALFQLAARQDLGRPFHQGPPRSRTHDAKDAGPPRHARPVVISDPACPARATGPVANNRATVAGQPAAAPPVHPDQTACRRSRQPLHQAPARGRGFRRGPSGPPLRHPSCVRGRSSESANHRRLANPDPALRIKRGTVQRGQRILNMRYRLDRPTASAQPDA